MYSCSSSHPNGLIWNQLEVQMLQKNGKCNYSFKQGKLIANTLSGSSTERYKSVLYGLVIQVYENQASFKMQVKNESDLTTMLFL